MKRIQIPLFWKLIAAINLIILLLGAIGSYIVYKHTKTAVRSECLKMGHYLAYTLAEQAVPFILENDSISLEKLGYGLHSIDSTVVYAFMQLSDRGIFLQFNNDFNLTRQNIPPSSSYEYADRPLSGHLIRNGIIHIKEPIKNGELGSVHIGMLEISINQKITRILFPWFVTFAVFMVLVNVLTGIFTFFITSPINQIIQAVESVNADQDENFKGAQISLKRKWRSISRFMVFHDEWDYLEEKLNAMFSRLTGTYQKLQTTQSDLDRSEKLATVGTLAAEIAHEINNPIAGLKNCVERMRRSPENIDQSRQYLELMEEAVLKMEGVVCGLLDYTRQENMVLEDIRIEEVLHSALKSVQYKVDIYQIHMIRDYADDLPVVSGSFAHLEQVFINLFVNAINAINEICKSSVSCQRIITISAHGDDSKLTVKVRDTGTGISSTAREKIFDPFFTTREIGMGTGLGLSICHNIIKEHNGEIKVDSRVGEWTAFTITLPAKRV